MDTAKKTIFVLEDDPFIAMDTADTLEELGYLVEGPYHSLAEAMKHCSKCKCDAALLDVNLGCGETSEAIADILRSREIPLAFISAYSASNILFRLETEPCLSKPSTHRSLHRILEELLIS